MKINQLKFGSVLAYLQMALNVIVGVVYTPIMLRLLGQSEYGLYSTVSSTISMLAVLSLGFNSGYIRYYSIYKKRKDEDAISRLNGLFLIIFAIIGFVALICGIYLSTHLELVFDHGLTAAEYTIARRLMLLLTVNMAISFPMSVFQNIISAHERYVFLKLMGMAKTVISPLIALPLLLMGYRSVAMVVATLLVSVIVDVAYFIYGKTELHVTFAFRNIENEIFKKLFSYTFFIFLNMIVDQVNNNLDKFLLGRYQGTVSVSVYALGSLLYSYFVMFSTAISGVFTPRIHRLIQTMVDKDIRRTKLTELFTKVGRVQFMVLALVASGFVFFGKVFIYYWAGAGYEESYTVALLLILPALVPLMQNLGIEIQRALNKHQFRSIAYIFMASINVFLTILLCQRYGAVGAAAGTAVSLVLMNGIVMNIYYHKKCDLDILAFWKSTLSLVRGLIIPVLFGITLTKILNIQSFTMMIFGIAVYIVVYILSMWFFGMNRYEKDLIAKVIFKVLKIKYD